MHKLKEKNNILKYPAAPRGAAGYFKILFSLSICALFFQTAAKLLGQTVIKLYGCDYLIKGNISFLFWPRDALKIAENLTL